MIHTHIHNWSRSDGAAVKRPLRASRGRRRAQPRASPAAQTKSARPAPQQREVPARRAWLSAAVRPASGSKKSDSTSMANPLFIFVRKNFAEAKVLWKCKARQIQTAIQKKFRKNFKQNNT